MTNMKIYWQNIIESTLGWLIVGGYIALLHWFFA